MCLLHKASSHLTRIILSLIADLCLLQLRHLLAITPEQEAVFERFSDSAGGYVTLDSANPAVFKTLIRAAKAKGKLRLKATVTPPYLETLGDEQTESTPSEGPVIARTPATATSVRASTAMDPISVGTGIFQFREAMEQKAEELKLISITSDEAPVPKPFTTSAGPSSLERTDFFSMLANHGKQQELALRTRASNAVPASTWSVYCNECDSGMDNVHFHCSICDGGDYDLCEKCVESGKLCPGEGHWLIKRTIADGKVIASTTERIAPKMKKQSVEAETDAHREIPGAFTEDAKTLNEEPEGAFRTCNSCIISLPEHEFVTCSVCDDFDLCRRCHSANKHGHHPAHHFEAAVSGTKLTLAEETLLPAGRNVRHNAVCDGCDKKIFGIRHKCFSCPDYDLCSECIKNARHTHPRHRFAALYDPIGMRRSTNVRHHGVYCDGPLCNDKPNQTYIQGVRYKCAVCHDTDFCAACEALPGTFHNKTHPLVKFKTPVNNLTISTESEDKAGLVKQLGDRETKREPETAPAVAPVSPKQTTSPVKTVADIKPTPRTKEAKLPEATPVSAMKSMDPIIPSQCNAHFVRDSVADGSLFAQNALFTQIWTIRNPGPYSWPAGCSVRFVGGDHMLNVSSTRPTTSSDLAEASETNVIGRAVYPGEEAAFKVVMRAPMRVGKAISYWRLKSADGTPFGHRLWCDITVKAAEKPKVAADNTPSAVQPTYLGHMMEQLQRDARPVHGQSEQEAAQAEVAARGQSYYALYQQRINAMKTAMTERAKANALAIGQSHVAAPAYPAPQAFHQMPAYPASNQALDGYQAQLEALKEQNALRRKTAMEEQMKMIEEKKARQLMMAREHRAQLYELNMSRAAHIAEAETAAVEPEPTKHEEVEMKGSQMVFPTLERESPASSTYQSMSSSSSVSKGKAAYVEDEKTDVKTADAAIETAPFEASTKGTESEEGFEDISVADTLEVLSADGDEESEDDGFMTDEEYDILDASDQETVASKE